MDNAIQIDSTLSEANTDVTVIKTARTSCAGVTPALGHPKVYLTVDKINKQVTCPYCGHTFTQKVCRG